MEIPVDELNIVVRLDGLALAKHVRGPVPEHLVTPGMGETVLRTLEADGGAEGVQHDSIQGESILDGPCSSGCYFGLRNRLVF